MVIVADIRLIAVISIAVPVMFVVIIVTKCYYCFVTTIIKLFFCFLSLLLAVVVVVVVVVAVVVEPELLAETPRARKGGPQESSKCSLEFSGFRVSCAVRVGKAEQEAASRPLHCRHLATGNLVMHLQKATQHRSQVAPSEGRGVWPFVAVAAKVLSRRKTGRIHNPYAFTCFCWFGTPSRLILQDGLDRSTTVSGLCAQLLRDSLTHSLNSHAQNISVS